MDAGQFHFRKTVGEKNMFDMNEQIKVWRSELSHKQTLEKSDIDELENHLREEIERLAESELTQEEAFMVAAHRLGHSESLSEEFAKINTSVIWRKRLFRVGTIVFAWIILTYIWQVVSLAGLLLGAFAGLRGYPLNIVEILSQVTFLGIVLFALYLISRKKDIDRISFSKITDSVCGKFMLFIIVFVIVLGILAFKTLIIAMTARILNPQEFREISMVKAYQELIIPIFLPLVVFLGTILVRPSKFREAEV